MRNQLWMPVLLVWIALVGCSEILPPLPADETVLAGPLEGMTPDQLKTHIDGDVAFARTFGEDDGLGPIFVSNSCESCHVGDGKGHPFNNLTRFGNYSGPVWDPMIEEGGPQLQHRAITGYPPETIPDSATGWTELTPPAVTGLGFLEAVPDSTLLALIDQQAVVDDGVHGAVNWVEPPTYFRPSSENLSAGGRYIGRFGKKSGVITLRQQVVNAYLQDMGITTDFEPADLFNPKAGNHTGDTVLDPEVSASEVNNVVFYIRTLKPPPRRNSENADVISGEIIFEQIGCATCHVPELKTGKSDVAALSEKTFYPYTDMLMHDMGPELNDGYTEGDASTSAWRTAPLWGIGLAEDSQGGSGFFLHDGRASTLEQAISLHGGEATLSRSNFEALSGSEQNQLIEFLKSL